MQSSLSRAQQLAQYAIADGNPALINTEMDAMLAVTPAQIQAAAKKYLTPERRAVLEIDPTRSRRRRANNDLPIPHRGPCRPVADRARRWTAPSRRSHAAHPRLQAAAGLRNQAPQRPAP